LHRDFPTRSATIIPLGPESLRDSSSLPEGRSSLLLRARCIRAGPALPSYLALLHAGFSVPRMLPSGRWALTPPFHPCQMRQTETGKPSVFPRACRRGASITGGLFSVALSVAALPEALSRLLPRNPLVLPGALPFTLRAASRLEGLTLRFSPRILGVRTFLPLARIRRSEPSQPAITRLTRFYEYTRCKLGDDCDALQCHPHSPHRPRRVCECATGSRLIQPTTAVQLSSMAWHPASQTSTVQGESKPPLPRRG
jgi:hypothetical protein